MSVGKELDLVLDHREVNEQVEERRVLCDFVGKNILLNEKSEFVQVVLSGIRIVANTEPANELLSAVEQFLTSTSAVVERKCIGNRVRVLDKAIRM